MPVTKHDQLSKLIDKAKEIDVLYSLTEDIQKKTILLISLNANLQAHHCRLLLRKMSTRLENIIQKGKI